MKRKDLSAIRMEAENGNVEAQVKLAEAYEKGQGVKKDLGEAGKWYILAIANGHWHSLGLLSLLSLTVRLSEKDIPKVEQWLELAIRHDLSDIVTTLSETLDGIRVKAEWERTKQGGPALLERARRLDEYFDAANRENKIEQITAAFAPLTIEAALQHRNSKPTNYYYREIAGQFPMKKIKNAIKEYVSDPIDIDDVIIFLDDTMFGSGTDGFLVTPEAFYYKEVLEKGKKFRFDEVVSVEFLKSFFSRKIRVKTTDKTVHEFSFVGIDKEKLCDALDVLATVNKLNHGPSHSEPAPGKPPDSSKQENKEEDRESGASDDNSGSVVEFTFLGYATASIRVRFVDENGNPVSGKTVTWSVEDAQNFSPAMMPGWENKKTGLTWGKEPESGPGEYDGIPDRLKQERIISAANNTSLTNDDGKTTMYLTDIIGERTITVKAAVMGEDTTYSLTKTITFGNGPLPLSVFKHPEGTEHLTWDEAYEACNGVPYPNGPDHTTGWTRGAYVGGGGMPTREEIREVCAVDPGSAAQGAAWAAGWPGIFYWTGVAESPDTPFVANLMGRGLSLQGDCEFLAHSSWIGAPVVSRREIKKQEDAGSSGEAGSDFSKMTLPEIRAAAENGNPQAQLKLGERYKVGYGVEKNVSEAVRWFAKAAKQGSFYAEVDLKVLISIEKDVATLKQWQAVALEHGLTHIAEMAEMYAGNLQDAFDGNSFFSGEESTPGYRTKPRKSI